MALSEFKEAATSHLRRLDGLIERGSVPRLRRLYEEAITGLERQLSKAVGAGAAPFTIQKAQTLLAQARQGLIKLSVNMGNSLGDQIAAVQEASARALIADVKKLEKAASGAVVQLPIEQASRFAGVIDKRRTSLLKTNAKSMAKYGASVVGKMEQALGQALLQGATGHAAIDKITGVMEMEWWRAERIARTETAWAYNATQMDAIGDAARAFPDIMMRWVEYVADVSLVKLDLRVGDDSVAMHGQLARPGTFFTMPLVPPRAGLKISPGLAGQTWTNPPNRPNDRAVLQPWRPGWGWGWVLVGGQRVVRT